jgi:uncharacterized Zn-binding protein involved in type VI secretion
VAREGDSVRYTCVVGDKVVSGTGSVYRGSSNIKAEGRQIARDGDLCNCGPCGFGTIKSTAKNKANGKPVARIYDLVRLRTGQGRIVTGAKRTSSD